MICTFFLRLFGPHVLLCCCYTWLCISLHLCFMCYSLCLLPPLSHPSPLSLLPSLPLPSLLPSAIPLLPLFPPSLFLLPSASGSNKPISLRKHAALQEQKIASIAAHGQTFAAVNTEGSLFLFGKTSKGIADKDTGRRGTLPRDAEHLRTPRI